MSSTEKKCILNLQLLSLTFVLTGINTSETHTKEWYQIQAVRSEERRVGKEC